MAPPPELRALPPIDQLLAQASALVDAHGRAATAAALRRAVDAQRQAILSGRDDVRTDAAFLLRTAQDDLGNRLLAPPRPVINATGVVVHTNLGRAPLSDDARAAVAAAAGYCDLETDLASGKRSSRGARLDPLLAEACGAEDAIAVNNAAGALVLVLAALAGGKQVLVSRGELVEIGGSFRLPDIMAASGARLCEVGTTNRTTAEDFADQGDDVALILSVHPSNFRIEGFTTAPSIAELAEVGARRGAPLVHDVGSGLLAASEVEALADEPTLQGSLRAGADLVLASGDKVLGGPQAGMLAGRADLVERCRRHPLARALRLDKLRIAALVATLRAHLEERRSSLPVWAMLEHDREALRARAEHIARRVGGTVQAGASLVGGGAAPGAELPSSIVRITAASPSEAAARLRSKSPAVMVRVEDGALWIDPRTVDPAEDEALIHALVQETA